MLSVQRQIRCVLGVLACVLVIALSWESWDFAKEFSTRRVEPTDDSDSPRWGLPFDADELADGGWYSFNLDSNHSWALIVPGGSLGRRLARAPVAYENPGRLFHRRLFHRPRWSLSYASLEEGPGVGLEGWIWWPVGDGTWYGHD